MGQIISLDAIRERQRTTSRFANPVAINAVFGLSADARERFLDQWQNGQHNLQKPEAFIYNNSQGSLESTLLAIGQSATTDHVLIEFQSHTDPRELIDSIELIDQPESMKSPQHLLRTIDIERIITVFSAKEFYSYFHEDRVLHNDIHIAEVANVYLEYTDLVVLTDCDHLTSDELNQLINFIGIFQARAPILTLRQGESIPESITSIKGDGPRFCTHNTVQGSTVQTLLRQYPFDRESENQKIILSLENGPYGVIYRNRRAFDTVRWQQRLEAWPEQLIRSAGQIWLWQDQDNIYDLTHIGVHLIDVNSHSRWIASLSRPEQLQALHASTFLRQIWHPTHGDRYSEIIALSDTPWNYDKFFDQLDTCLVSPWQMRSSYKK
jgi:G3E family GTPase